MKLQPTYLIGLKCDNEIFMSTFGPISEIWVIKIKGIGQEVVDQNLQAQAGKH